MYTATHFASSEFIEGETYKSGFLTKKKAWAWIKDNQLCSLCMELLKDGSGWIDKEEKVWDEITHASETACGALWEVIETKDFDQARKEFEKEIKKEKKRERRKKKNGNTKSNNSR